MKWLRRMIIWREVVNQNGVMINLFWISLSRTKYDKGELILFYYLILIIMIQLKNFEPNAPSVHIDALCILSLNLGDLSSHLYFPIFVLLLWSQCFHSGRSMWIQEHAAIVHWVSLEWKDRREAVGHPHVRILSARSWRSIWNQWTGLAMQSRSCDWSIFGCDARIYDAIIA